jgi:hypothetical protein
MNSNDGDENIIFFAHSFLATENKQGSHAEYFLCSFLRAIRNVGVHTENVAGSIRSPMIGNEKKAIPPLGVMINLNNFFVKLEVCAGKVCSTGRAT